MRSYYFKRLWPSIHYVHNGSDLIIKFDPVYIGRDLWKISDGYIECLSDRQDSSIAKPEFCVQNAGTPFVNLPVEQQLAYALSYYHQSRSASDIVFSRSIGYIHDYHLTSMWSGKYHQLAECLLGVKLPNPVSVINDADTNWISRIPAAPGIILPLFTDWNGFYVKDQKLMIYTLTPPRPQWSYYWIILNEIMLRLNRIPIPHRGMIPILLDEERQWLAIDWIAKESDPLNRLFSDKTPFKVKAEPGWIDPLKQLRRLVPPAYREDYLRVLIIHLLNTITDYNLPNFTRQYIFLLASFYLSFFETEPAR